MNLLRGRWLAVVAVLAVVGVVWLWPTAEPADPPGDETAPAATGSSAAPDMLVGPPPQGGHNDERQWTKQPWRPVAVGFARDFADPGKSMRDWRHRVGRWVSDYLAGQYEHTARYRIPVARLDSISGPEHAGQAVTVTASYDTGLTLLLHLEVFPSTGWKVTRVTPADDIAGIT